jgi:hypothetical protein
MKKYQVTFKDKNIKESYVIETDNEQFSIMDLIESDKITELFRDFVFKTSNKARMSYKQLNNK